MEVFIGKMNTIYFEQCLRVNDHWPLIIEFAQPLTQLTFIGYTPARHPFLPISVEIRLDTIFSTVKTLFCDDTISVNHISHLQDRETRYNRRCYGPVTLDRIDRTYKKRMLFFNVHFNCFYVLLLSAKCVRVKPESQPFARFLDRTIISPIQICQVPYDF